MCHSILNSLRTPPSTDECFFSSVESLRTSTPLPTPHIRQPKTALGRRGINPRLTSAFLVCRIPPAQHPTFGHTECNFTEKILLY